MSETRARHEHRAPSDCPVCGEHLAVTRLGCTSCGTELAGLFASCPYCALPQKDLDLLKVFLISRGNMREVEKHLGVSYPTARQRFADVLSRLGMGDETEPVAAQPPSAQAAAAQPTPTDSATAEAQPQPAAATQPAGGRTRDQILAEVAAGTLSPGEAQRLLTGPHPS